MRHWGWERLKDMLKVTQLIRVRGRTRIQVCEWQVYSRTSALCSDFVQIRAASLMTGIDHFRKQMLGIKAIFLFSLLMRVVPLSSQIQEHGLVHGVRERALFLAVPLLLGLNLYFGALWFWGTPYRQFIGSSVSREFLEIRGSSWSIVWCLPLISTLALAELAGTQAPFSKTMKHKRLLSLCFESTGFSSDWVAANYPPCNYGDPRIKQMGKSFVFKWRRNQYAGRKGSLFIWTDSRWLVAKRQRAGEPGLALDQSSAHRLRDHWDNRALLPLIVLCYWPAWRGQWRPRKRQPTEALVGQPPDLDAFGTSSPAILLLLNSDMLVCFIKENSRKDMQKPQPYGRPPWTAFIIQSFTKLER